MAGIETKCSVLNMDEEIELAVACRSLTDYPDNFTWTDLETIDASFFLDGEGAPEIHEGLCSSTCDSGATTGLSVQLLDAAEIASPVEAHMATDTNKAFTNEPASQKDVRCCPPERMTDSEKELFCSTTDAQLNIGLTEDTFAYLLSSCAMKDAGTIPQENSQVVPENIRVPYHMTLCSTDSPKGSQKNPDSHLDAVMEEVNQDTLISSDFDLPDGLVELIDYEYLVSNLDTDVLLGDPCLNDIEPSSCGLVSVATEVPSPPSTHQLRPTYGPTDQTPIGRKRKRVPRSHVHSNEKSTAKRKKTTGHSKSEAVHPEPSAIKDSNASSGLNLAGNFSATPPRVLHLYPSQLAAPIPIQFITLPDHSEYQVVQLPPSGVIRLPFPSTTSAPTYELVTVPSQICKYGTPPLSPVGGAVAPVQMSSSPPGSLSDSASKAMSPPCASPVSPSSEITCFKESPRRHSHIVPEIPQVVKDYIQEAKAHMMQTCQGLEAGIDLTSHYVDVKVSQRQFLQSGKNTSKCLDTELIIMGDTDRQKSLVELSQVFESSNGDKSKRYLLLIGNAGMGKTTQIKKLCLDWTKDCIPQFDFVFLLDGKKLSSKEPSYSLQTLLLNLSTFSPPCADPEAVYAQILATPKQVLIIFDGFDELRHYESLLQPQEKDLTTSLQKDSKAEVFTVRQLYSAILQRLLLPGCSLLLSSRPRGTASQLLRRADAILEVTGFTATNIETYFTQYFPDPAQRTPALDSLKNCRYLHLLCWNPGLCRLVCLVLESKRSKVLPKTLTGLCHQVICLKMENDSRSGQSKVEDQGEISARSVKDTKTQISKSSKSTRSRTHVCRSSRSLRSREAKEDQKQADPVVEEEQISGGDEENQFIDKELLFQFASLAWEGVKANSPEITTKLPISNRIKAFGLRTGLIISQNQKGERLFVPTGETEGRGREDKNETEGRKKEEGDKTRGKTNADVTNDQILLWANPFLQSYMAALHLSLSRSIPDRSFLLTLPFQSGAKIRRRPQREEFELTQRFTAGLLFNNKAELKRLHSYTEAVFRYVVDGRQTLVTKHVTDLSFDDLSPSQVLEACLYFHEAGFIHSENSRETGGTRSLTHLAAKLPEFLMFRGVPLDPPVVFTVQKALEQAGAKGREFCLDLEASGIQIGGLRALVALSNIKTYRACIADVVALWEQLEQGGEEELLKGAVHKFKIHPLKATQVCHIEHLAKLVNIHLNKRLSDSSSQSDSLLADGVPAVRELHKLEFELGPVNGPLALPKLWDLLPGLENLRHLDLENSKIGDKGAEKLADALVSLSSLQILNLSQNCIGDRGVNKLTISLKDLPKLHCLSLYSNVISDEGAESLAAVLPHMMSLTDLDVKYNKLSDVGARSLGASLKKCTKIKSLRMWNQCIPYGVFESLQQQDHRIVWH